MNFLQTNALKTDTSITRSQFDQLAEVVRRESGINLHEGKLSLLKARIAKRLRATNIQTVDAYIRHIENDSEEFLNFIDVMTTNHTYFFRENRHCEWVADTLDPSRPVKIWSAACSSGEEPYTIAIQLMEKGFHFSIFASDISDTMLRYAKRAIYPTDRARAVPQQLLKRYFQRGQNRWEGHIRVKEAVRETVSYGKHNLLYDIHNDTFDVIFCRNVMIYFDDPTREKVVANLSRSLKPGGYFVIGMSESLLSIRHPFKHVSASLYQS